MWLWERRQSKQWEQQWKGHGSSFFWTHWKPIPTSSTPLSFNLYAYMYIYLCNFGSTHVNFWQFELGFQATVDYNGRPSNRTVVFRSFQDDTDKILINTDYRTRKVKPLASHLFYFFNELFFFFFFFFFFPLGKFWLFEVDFWNEMGIADWGT